MAASTVRIVKPIIRRSAYEPQQDNREDKVMTTKLVPEFRLKGVSFEEDCIVNGVLIKGGTVIPCTTAPNELKWLANRTAAQQDKHNIAPLDSNESCGASPAVSAALSNAEIDAMLAVAAWPESFRNALAAQAKRPDKTALQRYHHFVTDGELPEPLERLRALCSLAMNGQDWVDSEPFFDAVAARVKVLEAAINYALEDEQNLVPRASSSCRNVLREVLKVTK